MKRLGYAVLVALAIASTDTFAMRKGTFMTRAMDRFVGQSDTALIDKMGRPSDSKIINGTTVNTYENRGCKLEVDIENHTVQRWAIRGPWDGCWPYFERLYRSRWLDESPGVAVVRDAPAQPAAQPASVAKVGDAYKVGIFPAIGQFIPREGSPWDEGNAAQNFRAQIAGNNSLALVYSHYEKGLDQPRLYDASTLWAANWPKLPVIYKEARARNLDAVFIYRGGGFFSGYSDRVTGPMPIELFLIDVNQERFYHRKGTTDDLQSMIVQLVSELLRGRRPS